MKNILLVDDENSLIMSMADGLESQGDQFRVYTANNGKEAVDTLETKPVDLVVTDLRMPEMDGFELLAYINDNRPSTPTIVMSAFATPRIEDKLKELGALQVLSKPLDFERLSEAIKQGLDHVFQGGSLAGISVGSFLQLMEAEQKTSLLEVLSEDKQKGFFYLDEGQLHDAVCGDMQGEEAAIEMLTWKGAQIRFRSLPEKKLKKNIHQGLMSLLMEASHLEDERAGAEAGPPSESLGEPDDLSLENVGEDGDESVLADDLSLEEGLGEGDVVSGDLGADDVDWLVEDLAPDEGDTVVEKVPGADEEGLFGADDEDDVVVPDDEDPEGESTQQMVVDGFGIGGGSDEPDDALEDDSDLFDINDAAIDDDDGDLFAADGEDDLFVVDDDGSDDDLFGDSEEGGSGDLFSVEEEPIKEDFVFDGAEDPGPKASALEEEGPGDLFTVEEEAVTVEGMFDEDDEPSADGGLFTVEDASEDEPLPLDLDGDDIGDGDLFTVEDASEDEPLPLDLDEEDAGDDGLFTVEDASEEEPLPMDLGEEDAGDDGQFTVEDASEEEPFSMELDEEDAGDDGQFTIEDASEEAPLSMDVAEEGLDDDLMELEEAPAEDGVMALDADEDSDADFVLEDAEGSDDGLLDADDGLMDLDDSLSEPAQEEEDPDELFDLDDEGLDEAVDLEGEGSPGGDDGLFDIDDELPDGDFSELAADDDLDFEGLPDSGEEELGDDGLPDLDMELPDEVPPPPPIMSAPAPRPIPPMANKSGASQDGGPAPAPSGKLTEEQIAKLNEVLKGMADEIEGVRVCAVSGMDGIGLVDYNPKGVDVQAFGGKFAVVMQLIGKSAQDLNIGQFQENLVQTENAWVLTRFLNPEYYLVIAVGRESTLGNVRMVAGKYSKELDEIFRA
ncbi:Protein with response regulator receiver domain [Desulfatibacillum aliphaticivorans]|uniref:Protein with response regulator receiver domain n=1 Tax=Desulfatibacillum aliphaticivorans TaxID=218208 RepID=B8FFC3_DESAL|nr:response regulator [Desulfatibacillum aliphaticivorans]ACL04183.1 Protein with response regulator receiver domain [Desulfatibacillum aliphaticivorans]